jgi:hypothetical protein
VTEISPAECESLLELYNSTDGANWTNNEGWNVTDTPCSWKGIACENNGVTKISLYKNQLTGRRFFLGQRWCIGKLRYGTPNVDYLAMLEERWRL